LASTKVGWICPLPSPPAGVRVTVGVGLAVELGVAVGICTFTEGAAGMGVRAMPAGSL
jgi:hypothetical protein